MPETYAVLTSDERNPTRKSATKAKLFLPCHPPRKLPTSRASSPALRDMEALLRWASMEDELENLRHQLRLRGCLYRHKRKQIRGQRASTRAMTAQQAVNANVTKSANAYRRHRAAYLALKGAGPWVEEMRELADSDCRGLGDGLIKEMERAAGDRVRDFIAERNGKERSGDTTRRIPWIWFATSEHAGLTITDGALSVLHVRISARLIHMAELMVEWCKSRARAQRWVEEVRLLDEEMRRVLAFCESMAVIWDGRRRPKETIPLTKTQERWAADKAWEDGVCAYACKQAWVRRAQAAKWTPIIATMRMEALTFLSTHTAEGICTSSPLDGLLERVDAMTFEEVAEDASDVEID